MMTRAFCLTFLLLASACDNGSTGCTSGETQACTCGSLSGTQTCGSDGTFGACMCTGTDAGMPDGGTSADAGTPDASTADGGSPSDGGDSPDAAVDGGTSTNCDVTGFSTINSVAEADLETDPPSWLSLNLTTSHESMYLDVLFSDGAPDTPHTHTFTGENYHDCNECLLMYAECPTPDSPDCGAAYLAVSGTLTYSTLSRTSLAGTLSGVRMIEVTLDDTLVSTPVPDGRVWCIPSLEIPRTDAPVD